MKKLIFTLLSFMVFQLAYSQTTYYWVGGTTATSFSSAANWNTQLGGGGSALPTSINSTNSVGFVFIISGLDLDDDPGSQTGPLTISATGTMNVGQLLLENLADVTLARTGSGTTTITINGLAGPDLVVNPGSKLSLTGTEGSMFVVLGSANGADVSAEISGDIVLKQGTSTANNRFTSRTTGAFVFKPGSTLTTESTYNNNPFGTTGSSTLPANNGVVFESGSRYFYNGGLSPFGSNSTSHLVSFLPGSKFHFRAPVTNTQMFSNRPYGDIFIENNATVAADGTLARVDSFVVQNGATFITDSSGSTPISGHVVNNGTIMVPATNPNRNNRFVMVGTNLQNISGTGTYTLADFIISNQSNVKLLRSVQVDTLTNVFGRLDASTSGITGAGTTTVKAPSSLNITGRTVVDSFIVTNVSDLTGIEVGMSVSGAGVQANTVVTNIGSAGTITLSQRMSATATTTALTIFNGQGVLPIRFGAVSANLKTGVVTVNWKVLTETDVETYVIERSSNGTNFTQVGTVTARGNSQYNFPDASPLQGNSFYRIKAVHNNGQALYSSILRIANNNERAALSVYPNPVVGKNVNLQFINLDKENYTLNVHNDLGQVVASRIINHQGGSSNLTIQLPEGLKAGMYRVSVKGGSTSLQQTIVVQ
jgi:hypothetical protein